jgi:hypothetical protein
MRILPFVSTRASLISHGDRASLVRRTKRDNDYQMSEWAMALRADNGLQ